MMQDERTSTFAHRHIGPRPEEQEEMLRTIGVASLDELIDQTVPASIRTTEPPALPETLTEAELLALLKELGSRNKVIKSYIGTGYYDCLTPSVILRNVLENPGWYTPYTPYQAEIAQGRLEALFNFQTMICDLTGMETANASLLDEATAAAEAMTMMARIQAKGPKKNAHRVAVSSRCFPQTLAVLQTRAKPLGIELVISDHPGDNLDDTVFGVLVQMPDDNGRVFGLTDLIGQAHEKDILVAVGTDLLGLTQLKPPGESGVDIVYGSAQRFGVPMGYGGPHAAFMATRSQYVREVPGRIIGLSIDRHGAPAYRLALQTREQHIRREKAKSNLCTAQTLLANIAGFYAVYHGEQGLSRIGHAVHQGACRLEQGLKDLGYTQTNEEFFDTLCIETSPDKILEEGLRSSMNFRRLNNTSLSVSLDETTTRDNIREILGVFARAAGKDSPGPDDEDEDLPAIFSESNRRTSRFLAHAVFRENQSETGMMRYLKQLENKDLGLDNAMIPLGSCTMKLSAASEMIPVTWPEFGQLHPFAPVEQANGYQEVFKELEAMIAAQTGLDAVSLQPNAGAQGEFAGLLVIRAFHQENGNNQRDIVLIPSSAHGTNPASAVMAGMKVVVVACDDHGNVDVAGLKTSAAEHSEQLAGLMITYPSTHGVFEESIRDICETIHQHGGQVYMDGANLNAQVGLTSPAAIGADVCHINLHKTYSIPHGGGGPGMGPIAVAEHLEPYLPDHPVISTGGDRSISAISAAPWGSASILLISYAYMRLLGSEGVTESSKIAILNANYLKARLNDHFNVLYTGAGGHVAHEMIFDLRPFKHLSGVDETDVSKRLMDYGFHAPTVSWPVVGTMMVEPTESEPKAELDRFCDALISIRAEIQEVIDGNADSEDNVLKNAPHTAEEASSDSWNHLYSREKAVYPIPSVKENKFWPAVGRIDNSYGDRNLVCTCPPVG